MGEERNLLPSSELLKLSRLSTPTLFNGWEQITRHDAAAEGFNPEELCDFAPQMGPMVGYAVTVVVEPSNPRHRQANPDNWSTYLRYVASLPGPKVVVVQDLDKPRTVGAFWGEVCSGVHRALGCVGTITDGAARDIDEIANVGFKVLARRLCVGHAHVYPARWNCPVDVFGRTVHPGQLVHADKHGFLAIPKEDEHRLLEAAQFMDANECATVIPATRHACGQSTEQIIESFVRAGAACTAAARDKFATKGEW
jgi:regulator of RNase E activity RraA